MTECEATVTLAQEVLDIIMNLFTSAETKRFASLKLQASLMSQVCKRMLITFRVKSTAWQLQKYAFKMNTENSMGHEKLKNNIFFSVTH